jgi:AcrR family transcriptional regulator
MPRSAVSISTKPFPKPAPRPSAERGPTELQRLQKQTSHEKLLEAAYLSFAELSYAATTVDHVVRRAEVNRSTFYRHFDSKFAIAKALFAEFWPRLFAEFDRLDSSDPSAAEIEEWITSLIIFYRANKPFYMTLGQIPALEPEGSRWEENVRQEIVSRLGQRIPAFRRAASRAESTSELRVRTHMMMTQFEMGVFYLAFRDQGPDRQALLDFTVREFREFIREEAGA